MCQHLLCSSQNQSCSDDKEQSKVPSEKKKKTQQDIELTPPLFSSGVFSIAMADRVRVRMAIVLGAGGAAVGGPEALRLLLAVAGTGRADAAGVAIYVFLICAFTALGMGNLLLARFFRDAPRNAPAPAPGLQRFAKVTAAAALAAMFFVTATLLAVPSVLAGRANTAGCAARSCSA